MKRSDSASVKTPALLAGGPGCESCCWNYPYLYLFVCQNIALNLKVAKMIFAIEILAKIWVAFCFLAYKQIFQHPMAGTQSASVCGVFTCTLIIIY